MKAASLQPIGTKGTKLRLAMALAASLLAMFSVRASTITDTIYFQYVPIWSAPEGGPPGSESVFLGSFNVPNAALVFYEDAGFKNPSDQMYFYNGGLYFDSDPDLQNLAALGVPVVAQLMENGLIQPIPLSFSNIPLEVYSPLEAKVPESGPGVAGLVTLLGLCGLGSFLSPRRQYVK